MWYCKYGGVVVSRETRPRSWQRLGFSRGIVSLCVGQMILHGGDNRIWRNEELNLISYSLKELLHDLQGSVSYDGNIVSLYL